MDNLVSNPMIAGLAGGLVLFVAHTVWSRAVGGPNEKSLPVQLREIDTKLAEINTKLAVIILNHKHLQKQLESLETDFWEHITKSHGEFGPPKKHKKRDDETDEITTL